MHDHNDLDRKPVSSQQGRDWLVTTRRTFEGAEVAPLSHHQLDAVEVTRGQTQHDPKHGPVPHVRGISASGSAAPTRNQVKITSVTVPDVSSIESLSPYLNDLDISKPITSENVLSNPKAVAKSLAEASDVRLGNLAKANNVVFLWQQSAELNAREDSTVPMQPIQTPILSGSNQAFSDLEERPESWIEKHERKESDRVSAPPAQDDTNQPQPTNVDQPSPSVASKLNTSSETSDNKSTASTIVPSNTTETVAADASKDDTEIELSGVLDSVIERSIPGESLVLQFVGTEWNRHVDATTATVASILAKRRLGSVLLIDSNAQTRGLTTSSGETGKPGLVDAVLESLDWRSMIRKGSASGVDFLPLGKREFEEMGWQHRLRSLAADLKKDYDYICVSSGSSDSVEGRMWSEVSDGCYLLVSQTNSNELLAQSAVAELQASGARLLGCVVTDSQA